MQATPNTEQGGVTVELTVEEAEVLTELLLDVADRIGDKDLYWMGTEIARAVRFSK